jgi:hypothetical protein
MALGAGQFFIVTSYFLTMWALYKHSFLHGYNNGIKPTKEYWRFHPFVAVKAPDM